MRIITSINRAHYRGCLIEGEKRGEGWCVQVTAGKSLPLLRFTRFRSIRSSWPTTLKSVETYIDEMLAEIAVIPHASAPEWGKKETDALRLQLRVLLAQLQAQAPTAKLSLTGSRTVDRTLPDGRRK
jgi:hypothetical protein